MANPILRRFHSAASNLPKMQRVIVPQPLVILNTQTSGLSGVTATFGAVASGAGAKAGHMAHIPFRRFALRAIGLTLRVTQGTTIMPCMTTVVGGTDTDLLASAIVVSTGGLNRGGQILLHEESGKAWTARPGAGVRTYSDTYKLSMSTSKFFTLDTSDTNFPSANRGKLPRLRVSASLSGIIAWYVVVDVLANDL